LAIGINTTRNQLRRNMIECITIRKGTARNSHIQKAGLFHSPDLDLGDVNGVGVTRSVLLSVSD
jgi:hypothetical protein